jgi:hypothetical protein
VEPKRRREATLAIVVVLLAIAAFAAYQTLSSSPGPSATGRTASNEQGRAAPRAGAAPPARTAGAHQEAPQVHLDALASDRPEPTAAARDIFRFRVKPPPPPPPPPRPVVGPQPPPPPPPPAPIPPIPLKFIGVVDTAPPGKRVAVLSDGRGAPVYGHEGETVLGQYRILRIGAESIEMSYLDGRGRQTIRLSGS